jgi:hypothetical protein
MLVRQPHAFRPFKWTTSVAMLNTHLWLKYNIWLKCTYAYIKYLKYRILKFTVETSKFHSSNATFRHMISQCLEVNVEIF